MREDAPVPGELTVRLAPSVGQFNAAEWNALGGNRNPFVSHEFLTALEDSGSVDDPTQRRTFGNPFCHSYS